MPHDPDREARIRRIEREFDPSADRDSSYLLAIIDELRNKTERLESEQKCRNRRAARVGELEIALDDMVKEAIRLRLEREGEKA